MFWRNFETLQHDRIWTVISSALLGMPAPLIWDLQYSIISVWLAIFAIEGIVVLLCTEFLLYKYVSSPNTHSWLSRGCHLCSDETGWRKPVSCRSAKCWCLLGASSFLRQSCIEPSWMVHPVRTVNSWTMIGNLLTLWNWIYCVTFLSISLHIAGMLKPESFHTLCLWCELARSMSGLGARSTRL